MGTLLWALLMFSQSREHWSETLFFLTENIQRKVMLYDCGNNSATVVDYMRKLRSLPYELIVPVYPLKDDMLLIQGEVPGDTWYGKVLSIDGVQSVDVYFFVEKSQQPSVYVRERPGRAARNTVSMDSVIGVARGHWINANCWQRLPGRWYDSFSCLNCFKEIVGVAKATKLWSTL